MTPGWLVTALQQRSHHVQLYSAWRRATDSAAQGSKNCPSQAPHPALLESSDRRGFPQMWRLKRPYMRPHLWERDARLVGTCGGG